MNDQSGRLSKETPTADLGIAGRRVPVHSHLVSIWEKEEDFFESVGFLEAGLRGRDHCVLLGDKRDHERAFALLKHCGIEFERAVAEGRLVVVAREPAAEAMLASVTKAFEAAVASGASLVRLFGNAGWGIDAGPTEAELVACEEGLNEIAARFPSVILCVHPVDTRAGPVARHGVVGNHARLLDEQRRDSAEMLRAIFDNIPVMVSLRDATGRLLLVNREYERVLGWSLREAQGEDLLAELYPDPETRRRVLESIRDADRRWVDLNTRTRDGRTIVTTWARVALSDGTRIGFGQDVSERKRAESALRESEQRFRAVFESALDAILIVDDDTCLTDANPAACALVGLEREQVVGRSLAELTAPGFDLPETWRVFQDAGRLQGEWGFRLPDGTVRLVEYSSRANVVPGRHVGVLRDVTERRKLEEELRRSEDYLAAGQALSHTGSWAWNVLTGEAFWSPETFRITGVDPAITIPSHELFLERLHPADRERVGRELDAARRERRNFESRFRFRGPGDWIRHVQSLGRPVLNEAGEVLEYVGVVMDVTERHQTEERLNQSAAELRALSERLRVAREEERTQMAREVHDELGQALTALRIDVAWLEQKLTLGGERRAELEGKLRSMSALVDTTLAAVQRIATELRPGVLDELGLEAAIEWYLREFEQRTGIACDFRSRLGGLTLDSGHSTAAFRIFQEALTNVARHSGATRTTVHLGSEGGRLRLEIQDNGRGIPEDRIESAESLGLVGMRERARALGGHMQIRGAAGRGTTVTLTIPP